MIAECPSFEAPGSLLVFSDDWGRHPSSCQHLIRNLLDSYPVLWVNTIGTRAPRLDFQTVRRVTEKLRQWSHAKLTKPKRSDADVLGSPLLPSEKASSEQARYSHPNLSVVNPKMWPWFGSDRDRRLNRWLLSRQLSPLIQQLPKPVVAVTTLPITADLPGVLSVDRWVYYCVDDFSLWPGLDGHTLRRMDCDMIRRADSLVAVSSNLQSMIAKEGRRSSLLTHGVDVEFWQSPRPDNELFASTEQPTALAEFPGPRIVFWGVIDRRMDSATLQQLSRDLVSGTIVLIGPQQDPDRAILTLPNVRTLPAQPLSALPAIAAEADVLIMPYADLPVTRAMQPLKLKEYLATNKAVVVNRLPSTDAWSDCQDSASTPEQFSRLVRERIISGIPASQLSARSRLQKESWKCKALEFEQVLTAEPTRFPSSNRAAELL